LRNRLLIAASTVGLLVLLIGCVGCRPPSKRMVPPPPPPIDAPAEVNLDDLKAERDPAAAKLKTWLHQLEDKQAELADEREAMDLRESALAVTKAGWQAGMIIGSSAEWNETWAFCVLTVKLKDDNKTLRLEVPYDSLKDFCGTSNLGKLIGVEVWFADKKLSTEKPSGLLNINLVERKR